MKRKKKKILVVASFGGHWIQLYKMIEPLIDSNEFVAVSTHPIGSCRDKFTQLYIVDDYSRKNWWKVPSSLCKFLRIIKKEKPSVIISTGAAPGLSALLIGRILGVKTLWIDSAANAGNLSGSAKFARRFAHTTISQWPHVAEKYRNVKFISNCFHPNNNLKS